MTEKSLLQMTRAQETGKLILKQLENVDKLKIENDSLIEEGAPIPPEPRVGHWRPHSHVRKYLKKITNLLFFITYSSSLLMDPELKLVSVNTSIELMSHKKKILTQFSCAMQMSFVILFVVHYNFLLKHG